MSSANCVPPLRFYSLPVRRNRPMKVPPLLPNSTFSKPPLFQFHHFVLFQRSFLPSNYSRLCSKPYAFGANMSTQGRDGTGQPSLDVFLSIAEVLCIVPSVVFSVGGVVGLMFPGTFKLFQVNSGNVFFVCQFFLLVTAVIIGGLIRQRQWQRIYRDDREASVSDLVQRIEKVEEDLRSSVKIVRVLSRQLEKLGIRFRVTRKALKDPIAEAAALAQKNSEATKALALQEDVLEKELGEIQKVLLAMQEQQQKQLDLILAVAKAGRLFRDKSEPATDGAVGKIDLVQGLKKESELLAESKTGGRRGSPK